MYYYYDSDTSKQVMPQIVRENCYKKGGYHRAPVVYQCKCTKKGGCRRVPVVYQCKCTKRGATTVHLWCISLNVHI